MGLYDRALFDVQANVRAVNCGVSYDLVIWQVRTFHGELRLVFLGARVVMKLPFSDILAPMTIIVR